MFREEDKKRRQKESGQAAFVSNVRYAYTSVTAQIGRSRILLIDLPQPSASVGITLALVQMHI